MSFIDLFSDKADLYASARPCYPDELFAFVASTAPARDCAWDCGTGNGQAAVSLAGHFTAVFATDPSEEQIARGVQVKNVRYAVEPAEHTSLADGSVDAICVAQALHWFSFNAFFDEVRRVATPGALFIAWGYDWLSISPDFDAVFQTSILDIIAPYWAPQNRALWSGYTTVPMPFERIPTPQFHIRARWEFAQLLAYVHTWSATRRGMAALGTGFFESAAQRLAPLWGPPQDQRLIDMPLHVLAGRVACRA
jgi:SAM-dependent methyltransferase